MKISSVFLLVALASFLGCHKASPTTVVAEPGSPTHDGLEQKLQQYAGGAATDCGRLGVGAPSDRSKSASDCAMQASQGKHPFYVAYDMPGMSVGVAGNAEGKLYSIQSQGGGASPTMTSGDCPSTLRVAGSGRVTCFAPGDMGAFGGGHTAIPEGMPDPHALPKVK